ncbi:MAG TPA: outer membrane lipoprotein-sorting protein [Spirochaetota bacterium]|nr:outer membrane lipoprotein-sorting protein [Spirochaetota bacterium]HPI89007.1 outer membrane lipoprotein-sorting protein [Spirochaetota bacterium]HPR49285.1 outer membrane lipoprotein-sorting protein [Spirochaetota bacterium]
MKKNITHAIAVIILFLLSGINSGFPQEEREIELTAQGILARVDRVMDYPVGLIKGRMKHIKPDGESYTNEITGKITKDDFLFILSNKERGEQVKILYNLSGEDIWVYLMHSIKLYHKLGIDKYDPILMTNYYYIDLSNADLQSNYTAEIIGSAVVKEEDTYILKLKPIFKGGMYGLLTLYVTKKNFIPIRIDYHDRDNVIFKFMTVAKVMEKGSRIVPVRYDMMDLRTGTMTILSFFSFDESVIFGSEIFRSEKLGEP